MINFVKYHKYQCMMANTAPHWFVCTYQGLQVRRGKRSEVLALRFTFKSYLCKNRKKKES